MCLVWNGEKTKKAKNYICSSPFKEVPSRIELLYTVLQTVT